MNFWQNGYLDPQLCGFRLNGLTVQKNPLSCGFLSDSIHLAVEHASQTIFSKQLHPSKSLA